MSRKLTPYLFLIFLIVVLFFILGVRYGQKVEQTNKTIRMVISIPPTATLAPTSPPLSFKTYSHEACKVSFLYPSILEVDKSGSNGAMLKEDDTIKLSFDCDPKRKTMVQATHSAQLMYSFSRRHPYTGRILLFSVEKTYLTLLEKSLEFTAK